MQVQRNENVKTDLKEPWKWRSSCGTFRTPQNMDTSHLFNTLKMIWNNFMPAECGVGVVRYYNFGLFYTDEYMQEAIKMIGRELFKRENLTDGQRAILEKMASYKQNMKLEDKHESGK